MISFAEAQALVLAEAHSFGIEKIALEESFGRVLAEDAAADRDYPPFNRAAMDGYAIRAANYVPGKVYQEKAVIFAGDAGRRKLEAKPDSAIKIMTGAAVPAPFDAVIRREDATAFEDSVKLTAAAVASGHNISARGEDLKRGEKISLKGRLVDNATASLMASLGLVKPQVARLPSVAIVSTGNEIISPGKKPGPVQIRNSNVFALRCQLAGYGINRIRHIHVADDEKKLRAAILKMAKPDILLLTGAVSAGDSDFVPGVLSSLGFEKKFHKVQIKPGKPLWFGRRGKTTVFATPGNPLSAQVVFRIFVEPYLRKCLGMNPAMTLSMPLAATRSKKDSLDNFFPVKIQTHAGSVSTLMPQPYNGSGDIRAALFSDGLVRHPAGQAELKAGNPVEFYPWRMI